MTKFDCKETEINYYEALRKLGIGHILWDEKHIVTQEDIEMLLTTEPFNQVITNKPFEEFP